MGKVVLVTGGSRGIGAAVSRLAARDGWDVAIAYRARADAAERVAEDVRSLGRRVITIACDITDPRAVCRMFDQAAAELGYVEALVSNAGVIHRAAPLVEIPTEEIRRIVETDLVAHIVCNREAVRRMARSRGGRGGVIVNISSMAPELKGAGGFVPYAAAKAGIDVLTEGLGKEVAHEGIRVNGLRPGLIDTDMQADTGVPERIQRFGPTVPLGRAGRPEEVAEAVVWLLSDKASYVAATVFNVSGGR
ncbi:MAG: oxidoreductase [Geminicoccaceae bacterium]|nr:MAG: oxidoreductase [Geminicoccaceae bacterium]